MISTILTYSALAKKQRLLKDNTKTKLYLIKGIKTPGKIKKNQC